MTLAEIIIVSALFLIITFFAWSQIVSSFKALEKSESDSFRLLGVKKVNRVLEHELKNSDTAVIRIIPSKYMIGGNEFRNYSIILMSSVDNKGDFELDGDDKPKWLRKCIFYMVPGKFSVYMQQIPQTSPSSVRTRPDGLITPKPQEDQLVANGILELYFTDDKMAEGTSVPVGDHIICEVTSKGDQGLITSRTKVTARISKNH